MSLSDILSMPGWFIRIGRVEILKDFFEILGNEKLVSMIFESQKNIICGRTQTLDDLMTELSN